MTEPILAAREIVFDYQDGIRALNGISITIAKGRKTAILGPNGAGKSTLLLHFNGVLRPRQGKILFQGREVDYKCRRSIHELRKNVGIVFQDPDSQLFSASVLQDVAFGPLNLGLPRELALAKSRQALRDTGIEDLEKKPTHFLSYGQKKRVCIAGVLAMEPQVIIADEPTAGLDPKMAGNLIQLLNKLSEQGKTLVISTHDVDLAYSWADYVYFIHQGRVCGEGPPREVFLNKDLLEKCNLKSPWVLDVHQKLVEKGLINANEPVPQSGDELLNFAVRNNGTGRRWRKGYTTGSCAAAAAKGAVTMLLSGKPLEQVTINTPAGTELNLTLHDQQVNSNTASCSVIKDAGDDPDITNGIKVYARACWRERNGIEITAGEGVGRVTKPGLAIPVGEPAINPVPRQMIIDAVSSVINPASRGVQVEISVPEGDKLASKTLNPNLGIEGGISILGTTGIVVPMSEEAFKNSLVPQIKVALAQGEDVLVFTPGRMGQNHAKALGIPETATVQMSNFVGFMLDQAVALGVERIILLGHPGKLAKVAAGVFHTHSKIADVRMEALITQAALAGVEHKVITALSQCVTAEAAIELLRDLKLEYLLQNLAAMVSEQARKRVRGQLQVGTILLSLKGDVVAHDEQALQMGREKKWFTRLK